MGHLNQSQVQKILQRFSPQQIQMIKLLELPTIQLEQKIKKEIEENPALEEDNEKQDEFVSKEIDIENYKKVEDIPAYRLQTSNYSRDDIAFVTPLSDGHTLMEYLNEQLSYLSIDELTHTIAKYIIGSLDRSGYLHRSIENIADDISFNMNIDVEDSQVEYALQCVQGLEPSGIAARDVKETLTLQLKRMPQSIAVTRAITVLEQYFDLFAKKHYDKIVSKMGIEPQEFREVISVITNLSPKPANLYSEQLQSEPTIQITPDFLLVNEDGVLEIVLNKGNQTEIKINSSYLELLSTLIKKGKAASKNSEHIAEESKEAASFIRQKIDSAKWFISAVKQRNITLIMTMSAIVNFQKEYFQDGDETRLKPMILKNIADITGLDVSTISRVVNSKYIQTDFGIFALKYFFSEAMQNSDGEEISSREIKSILMQCVENEDKRTPLTDEALMDILHAKGYKIARRTVAKYREMLGITVARMRKEF